MQLITRCFAFYSVLLFLLELSFAQGLNDELNACEKAVDNLFRRAANNLSGSGGYPYPQDFLFSLTFNLVDELSTTKESPGPQDEGKLWRKPGEKLLLNSVIFDSNHAIQFDMEVFANKVGFICMEEACKKTIAAVKAHWSIESHQLSCLKERDGPYIKGNFLEGVTVRLPWNRSYLVLEPKKTLTLVMESFQDLVSYHWVATRVIVSLKDNLIEYMNASDRRPVLLTLPPTIKAPFYEYIEQAAYFFNEALRAEGQESVPDKRLAETLDGVPLPPKIALSFDKIPRVWLRRNGIPTEIQSHSRLSVLSPKVKLAQRLRNDQKEIQQREARRSKRNAWLSLLDHEKELDRDSWLSVLATDPDERLYLQRRAHGVPTEIQSHQGK